jgi:anionic cell wall polymer biosynthesis LytR-Cps2A-Psr (LCP) family protein
MPREPPNRAPSEDPPYRVYRGESKARPDEQERPYNLYRSAPKGLRARLRGEEDPGLPREEKPRRGKRPRREGPTTWRERITPRRVLKYLAIAIVGWLLLSLVLFLVSAQIESGSLPSSAVAALSPGGNMLTSTDTILVLGTDQRPKGSKEPGANTSDKGSRSDTMMLWRIGGGVSRRLSIPRDTVAAIPGFGSTKINAAYAYGGPALAIKTVEQFTGVKINHLVVINLANFPKFIDAIGGVDVKTGRIQALTLARTRENACNAASNDLTREGYQQKILNSIKSKLLSPLTFFRLPWASWYAPQTLRTDMGGFTMLSLFAAAELGGSAPTQILKPTGSETLPDGEDALVASPADVHRAVAKLMNG